MSLAASIRLSRRDFELAVEFDVTPSRTLALVGPNGAGKTTTISAIAGLVPLRGTVVLDGRVLDDSASSRHLPAEHRRVGVLFQDYLLFPHLSVLDNVAFAPRARGLGRQAAREAAAQHLDRLGIAALSNHYPTSLSGGQSQMVALARTLASDPLALVLDEPLAALDVEVRADTRAELASHLAGFPGPVIVVTHDLADVAALAADVIVIENGAVTQRDTLAQLMANPATTYVERLVAGGNR